MTTLLLALSKLNNFNLVIDPNFLVGKSQLNKTLSELPENSVYINHCNYLAGFPKDKYVWINVARDPVELEESSYYYTVSEKRSERGQIARDNRKEDPCGCADEEFDECYRSYMHNDACAHRLKFKQSEIKYFREATENVSENNNNGHFTGAMAYDRVEKDYLFVGITDELELTIMALEKLLPRFFLNATAVFKGFGPAKAHANTTPLKNKITNTDMKGAISSIVRNALVLNNRGDVDLFENIKRLFWWRVVGLFPEPIMQKF